MNRAVQMAVQPSMCTARYRERYETAQSRAVIELAAVQRAEQTRYVPQTVPHPFLRVEQWYRAEQIEVRR